MTHCQWDSLKVIHPSVCLSPRTLEERVGKLVWKQFERLKTANPSFPVAIMKAISRHVYTDEPLSSKNQFVSAVCPFLSLSNPFVWFSRQMSPLCPICSLIRFQNRALPWPTLEQSHSRTNCCYSLPQSHTKALIFLFKTSHIFFLSICIFHFFPPPSTTWSMNTEQ